MNGDDLFRMFRRLLDAQQRMRCKNSKEFALIIRKVLKYKKTPFPTKSEVSCYPKALLLHLRKGSMS
jgi:hypothetical protein